jgi:sortase A
MSSARSRPSLARLVGALLVLAGLAMLAWLGWQTWGTTWQSQRVHDDLVTEAERSWGSGEPFPTSKHGEVTAVVRIPAFGDDYAVPVLEGTSERVLAAGFGHFEGAAAGGRGNYALAGHRVTHGEPLRDMPGLEPGDEVVVETPRWVYTYVLDTAGDALTVDFTQTWVVDERPKNPDPGGVGPVKHERLLTLTTCAELFNTADRLIAFGHLESKERRR